MKRKLKKWVVNLLSAVAGICAAMIFIGYAYGGFEYDFAFWIQFVVLFVLVSIPVFKFYLLVD